MIRPVDGLTASNTSPLADRVHAPSTYIDTVSGRTWTLTLPHRIGPLAVAPRLRADGRQGIAIGDARGERSVFVSAFRRARSEAAGRVAARRSPSTPGTGLTRARRAAILIPFARPWIARREAAGIGCPTSRRRRRGP